MPIETEIKIRTDSLAADRARVEGEFDKLKSRVEGMELKLRVVFNDKEALANLDKLLADLQTRANAKPIVVPVQMQDRGGGMPGGDGAGAGGIEAAAAGAAGSAAAGAGAGSGFNLPRGAGRLLGVYAIVRSATALINTAADYMDERAARASGDIDKEVKAIEARRQAITNIPLAGMLGGAVNRLLFTGPEQRGIDQVKREAEEQDKIVAIMERRNEVMKKSIEHAKEITRQAQLEEAARSRPELRALLSAQQRLNAFDTAMEARQTARGKPGLVDEEKEARAVLGKNAAEALKAFDQAVIDESRKAGAEGAKALAHWRSEMERWIEAAEKAAEVERQRQSRLDDIRAATGATQLRMSGRGDDADLTDLARSFDKRIRDEKDAETKHALQLQKNAAMQELLDKQETKRAEEAADNWERAADAADAAARRILDIQGMRSEAQELGLRNRGMGAAADFVRVRQRVRDIFAAAGDDPEKQDAARQIGIGLLDQFAKGQGGRGGMFGGGIDFARSTQQAILGGEGQGRELAIDFARALSNEMKAGGNPLGAAAKDISDAAKAFEDAARNMQYVGVIRR